jgi:hypothetical protein
MEVFHTVIFVLHDGEKGMKKLFVLVFFLLVISTAVFALDNNFGFGLGANWADTSGTISYYGSHDWSVSRYGGYAFLFFGITRFIELNLGYIQKFPQEMQVEGSSVGITDLDSTDALQFGLYGKFPIPLGNRFVIFPTLGADFEYTLGLIGGDSDEWWHDLWLRGGVGMDFFLGEKLFLRAHFLGGYAIPFGGEERLGLDHSLGAQVKLGLGWMF